MLVNISRNIPSLQDGTVALDDATMAPGHSPFTVALMENLVRADLSLGMLIPSVTDSVKQDTQNRQVLGPFWQSICCLALKPSVSHDVLVDATTRCPS